MFFTWNKMFGSKNCSVHNKFLCWNKMFGNCSVHNKFLCWNKMFGPENIVCLYPKCLFQSKSLFSEQIVCSQNKIFVCRTICLLLELSFSFQNKMYDVLQQIVLLRSNCSMFFEDCRIGFYIPR